MTEMRYRHKSGAWRWIEARISNLLDHPAVNGIVINYSDITDRKNTGEILRKSEAKLWSVLETVPDFIMQIDAAGTVEFINHVLPGLALEHIIGAKLYDFLLAGEHGRGLVLMRAFMDEVTYNDAGNEVTMVKRRPPDVASS